MPTQEVKLELSIDAEVGTDPIALADALFDVLCEAPWDDERVPGLFCFNSLDVVRQR